jgi:DhnA family fructose-bisphosphate aldolase class Ia
MNSDSNHDQPIMKLFRLNRLFNGKSRRCFDVAIDHGFFNELGFLSGIEDLEKAVETLVGAGPDAIQLTAGQAEVLQRIPGKAKPALVLRTDVANVYGRALPRTLFSRMIDQAVEQALRLDATCVVVNLFQIPEQPEVSDQCIRNIAKLKPECDRYANCFTDVTVNGGDKSSIAGFKKALNEHTRELLAAMQRASDEDYRTSFA